MAEPNFYTEEQVQQLLHHAIARKSNGQDLSREQVYEIASELGISRNEFLASEQEWQQKYVHKQDRQVFDDYKKKKLRESLLKYAIVNTFLVAINLITSGNVSWAFYPLLFWGLGMALDSWVTYQPDSEEYEKQFLKWSRQKVRDRITNQITDKVASTVEDWLKPKN
jgi:hypothetical protein